MIFDSHKRSLVVCFVGFLLSFLLLATGLPMRNVSALGQIATATFLVLNPPFVAVLFVTPYEAHELETSSWPEWEYPVAIIVSVAWWAAILLALRVRAARRANNNA